MSQYLRPTSDVVVSNWTPSTGSTCYACLDETAYNDADYISSDPTKTAYVTLGLSGTATPYQSGSGTLRIRVNSSSARTFTVILYDSAGNAIGSPITLTSPGGGWSTVTSTISETDLASLARIRLTAARRALSVSWIEVETPEASAPSSVAVGLEMGVIC